MHALGKYNWYLPAWLNRRLPHIDIESDADRRRLDPVPARQQA
jgi:hypothetical protein